MSTCEISMLTCDYYVACQHNYLSYSHFARWVCLASKKLAVRIPAATDLSPNGFPISQ